MKTIEKLTQNEMAELLEISLRTQKRIEQRIFYRINQRLRLAGFDSRDSKLFVDTLLEDWALDQLQRAAKGEAVPNPNDSESSGS